MRHFNLIDLKKFSQRFQEAIKDLRDHAELYEEEHQEEEEEKK